MARPDPYRLLVPCRCSFCGGTTHDPSGLCSECRDKITLAAEKSDPLCPVCSLPQMYRDAPCPFCERLPKDLSALVCHGYFHGELKELVAGLKKGSVENACFLAERLYRDLKERGWDTCPLVPIPPRRGKIRWYGWDQVRALSHILKKRFGMTVFDCLKRIDRVQQKSLDYDERSRHMEKSLVFRKKIKFPAGTERVIVLDDIFTSGATLGAAASLLKTRFACEINGVVLCFVL